MNIYYLPPNFSAKCCISVGDGEVLWQQNHLWPDRGEAQRHHFHSGRRDELLSAQNWQDKKDKKTKTRQEKKIVLLIAEWRVPETWRDLRRFLFGKIGRHVWQPPTFCHVIYTLYIYTVSGFLFLPVNSSSAGKAYNAPFYVFQP